VESCDLNSIVIVRVVLLSLCGFAQGGDYLTGKWLKSREAVGPSPGESDRKEEIAEADAGGGAGAAWPREWRKDLERI
jgi:hypothetical protein